MAAARANFPGRNVVTRANDISQPAEARPTRRGRPRTFANDLALFIANCASEARREPLLPWLAQLPQKQLDLLYDVTAAFIGDGWLDSTDKHLVPLVRLFLECERPDLAADPEFLNEGRIDDAIMELNSTLCVCFGVLPACDGEVVYLTAKLFPTVMDQCGGRVQ